MPTNRRPCVAELVARGAALDDVFRAVTIETAKLVGSDHASLHRHERDGTATTVATYDAGHAATPNAGTENKADLAASRARVVAAADETRRRLQRDVHDGAQQRLVQTIIVLKIAREAIARGETPSREVSEALHLAERASAELRDVVQGILPASLTRGGLRTGLESLVDDLGIPANLRVTVPRLSRQIETTVYFFVAEALTNVVKHARATYAEVTVDVDGATLRADVRDDGIGGADPAGGTGLTGLSDRIQAVDGTLTWTSAAGSGTVVRVTLPLGEWGHGPVPDRGRAPHGTSPAGGDEAFRPGVWVAGGWDAQAQTSASSASLRRSVPNLAREGLQHDGKVDSGGSRADRFG